jgi:tagatose 6-phosphate kinase
VILTVTLNTALGITYRVPSLRPHAAHRVTETAEQPGGKGQDVARNRVQPDYLQEVGKASGGDKRGDSRIGPVSDSQFPPGQKFPQNLA